MVNRAPLETKIKKAKIHLLFKQPFFGTLIMHLPLVDVTDAGWCPTAAVDGRNIFYNRDFFNKLSVDEIEFVLCHEVLHVAFDHLTRKSHRDPEWWNMANDYVINGMLVSENIGKMPTERVTESLETGGKKTTVQRVGLYNAKYLKWSSEAVYEDLEKRKVKKELTLDVHLGNPGKGQDGKIPIDLPINNDDLEKLRDEIKAKVLQAATAAAGKLPAGISRLIDDLIEPKINWRDFLKQTIQSCIVDDFTWMKVNRKHMYSGIFLPTLKKDETVNLQIAIDMSGSISDEMGRDFLSEIYGIMNQYHDFTIGILTFDTKVYNYKEFTKETADDLLSYKLQGGGGTDFQCFWNYWEKNYITPKLALVFTDGYPNGTWGPKNYCDTLWIITDGKQHNIKPPFGSYVHYSHKTGIDGVGEV
jgi:predicted metal-dependent peptidase